MNTDKNFARIITTEDEEYLILKNFDSEPDETTYILNVITQKNGLAVDLGFKFQSETERDNLFDEIQIDRIQKIVHPVLKRFQS